MFNSSIIARRLLKSRTQAIVVLAHKRMMSTSSALLVPLQEKEQLPFELRSTDLTDAEFDKIQTEYREFNVKCSDELKEMNQNRITNIIERGGVEGWDTVSFILILFQFIGCRPFLSSAQLHLQLALSGSIFRPGCEPLLLSEGPPSRVVDH